MKWVLIVWIWLKIHFGIYELPNNKINEYYAEMPVKESMD